MSASELGVPGQKLLPSMAARPVPGWRLDLRELLPDTSNPHVDRYVGHVGDVAYFTVIGVTTSSGRLRIWLAGVDVTSGAATFPPVYMPGHPELECYLNGPDRMLCVQLVREPDPDNPTNALWVVDTTTGEVLHYGPTELNDPEFTPFREIQQVGGYALAVAFPKALYGLDDRGQTTWSLGTQAGRISGIRPEDLPGDAPSKVAVLSDHDSLRAIDVATGDVLLHNRVRLEPMLGGYVTDGDLGKGVFGLYDEAGAETGRYQMPERMSGWLTGPGQLPMLDIKPSGTGLILDRRGVPMAEIESPFLGNSRILGSSVYVSDSRNVITSTNWAKCDLRTGKQTSPWLRLPLAQYHFGGSDGAVIVGSFDDPHRPARRTFVGIDSDSGETRWEIGDVHRMWAIGSTLVQSRLDSCDVISLVPPG